MMHSTKISQMVPLPWSVILKGPLVYMLNLLRAGSIQEDNLAWLNNFWLGIKSLTQTDD